VSTTPRAVALAGGLIGLDQATKALVRANLERGDRDAILPGVELVNGRNTGVAFGLLEGSGAIIGIVTMVAVVALLAFFAVQRTRRPGVWVPTGLLLGGAIGNAIDRLFRDDGVTDFIKLPVWPAFNVADVAITFGVLALMYVMEGRRHDEA
jgi:signal peptidase II